MPDPRDVDPEDFDTEPPERGREDDEPERGREEPFNPTSRDDEDRGEAM